MKHSKLQMERAANNIRIFVASMVEKAKSGHPGGAMGGADFANVLYSEFLEYDPNNPQWRFRDRFFLDPGHMSPMLYSVLALSGKYSMEDLKSFRQWGSVTPGHPEVDVNRGVENTSGPLGQGHTMAVGAAIAERFIAAKFGEWTAHKTYAFISDGGIQEEISQGAGRLAGYFGLSNLIMFYDANNVQLSTKVDEVTAEDTAKKYEAWGWRVMQIDGNDADQIRAALLDAKNEKQKPTLIIGKTVMGKGLLDAEGQSFENKISTHGQPISAAGASLEKTVENLGGDPQNPFVVFEETKKIYAQRAEELKEIVAQKQEQEKRWRAENPELAEKLDSFFSGVPQIDFSAIVQKDNQATRVASATVLSVFAEKIENMMVSSADLSNSDKTDGFMKGGSGVFSKENYAGRFINAGVSELTMASVMNGIALHGGIIPVCGTFFVFSDYMKPAIRMAALMRLPVKYVWTHDAFRVGEDGPTHQPVEQELQIRLMERLKNHDGKNSMLVLRPADVNETTVAWQLALENTATPTGLILTRQNISTIMDYEQAKGAKKGAYVLKSEENPDVVLLANGSEVSALMEVSVLLKEKGIKASVVSAPSEGLFFSQSNEYRQSVIPNGIPVFGLTAGLSTTLSELVGPNGVVYGLDHFGYSAPFKVLDEKFGFTPENIFNQVVEFLK